MKSLIALIAAITVGGFGGWSLGNHPNQQRQMDTNKVQESAHPKTDIEVSSMPVAEDFLSLRPALDVLPSESLSKVEITGLLYTREEQKLARDVYLTPYDTWSLRIFSNIAQSEQTHTESVGNLLEKYNITDPVTDDTVGVFVNANLQKLYIDLTTRGNASIEEALVVGAVIEDLDIYDLQQEISKTDNQDITLLYENLMWGSHNHMRAFISQLTSRGKSYIPQYITQADFDNTIEAGQGRSSGNGNSGNGRGWGQNN